MKRLILLLLLPFAATAQVTYDYTGAALIDTVVYPTDGTPYVPTALFGDIVLANALNPNEANQTVTPLSFNFSSSNDYLSSIQGVQDVTQQSFTFSTQNGAITAWNVDLATTTLGTNSPLQVNAQITSAGDNYDADQATQTCAGTVPAGIPTTCWLVQGVNSVAGSWVDPPAVQAPEIGPNVAALTLLLGMLAVMRGFKPKRSLLDASFDIELQLLIGAGLTVGTLVALPVIAFTDLGDSRSIEGDRCAPTCSMLDL